MQENEAKISQGVSTGLPAFPKLALASKTARGDFLAGPGASISSPNRKQEAARQVITHVFGWLPKLSTSGPSAFSSKVRSYFDLIRSSLSIHIWPNQLQTDF